MARSPDFWGSLTYPTSWHIKVKLVGLLVISGVIALLAGPSTAILMLPRAQDWLNVDDIFLPGDSTQYWPNTAAANNPGITLCNVDDEVYSETCLTASHYKVLTLFSDDFETGPFNVGLSLANQDLMRYISGSVRRKDVPDSQSWTTVPHLASCYLQSAVFSQWVSTYFYSRQRNHATQLPSRPNVVAGRVPVVRTVCVPQRKITNSTT